MRIVVDFPAPLGPRKPTISPRLTSKLILSRVPERPEGLREVVRADHHVAGHFRDLAWTEWVVGAVGTVHERARWKTRARDRTSRKRGGMVATGWALSTCGPPAQKCQPRGPFYSRAVLLSPDVFLGPPASPSRSPRAAVRGVGSVGGLADVVPGWAVVANAEVPAPVGERPERRIDGAAHLGAAHGRRGLPDDLRVAWPCIRHRLRTSSSRRCSRPSRPPTSRPQPRWSGWARRRRCSRRGPRFPRRGSCSRRRGSRCARSCTARRNRARPAPRSGSRSAPPRRRPTGRRSSARARPADPRPRRRGRPARPRAPWGLRRRSETWRTRPPSCSRPRCARGPRPPRRRRAPPGRRWSLRWSRRWSRRRRTRRRPFPAHPSRRRTRSSPEGCLRRRRRGSGLRSTCPSTRTSPTPQGWRQTRNREAAPGAGSSS